MILLHCCVNATSNCVPVIDIQRHDFRVEHAEFGTVGAPRGKGARGQMSFAPTECQYPLLSRSQPPARERLSSGICSVL